ncbi:MAG: thioredoxin family protein [Chlorobi bacterium]|nr:thioredoxin family protein [Chlorobiota bacterium]
MNKRKWLLALVMIYAGQFFVNAQQTKEYGGLTWYLDYEQAKKIAIKEHKPIIILFTGSDWCPPCMALKKEVLPNPEFKKYAKDVILVLADFPRRTRLAPGQQQKNRALAAKFLGRSGLPTMVGVDPRTDSIISHITGYNFYSHNIGPHIQFIQKVIKAVK